MSDTTTLPFGNIEPIEIQEEMERSFLDYAMSVIVSRALPDVRDGLKPVHRRILWDMFDQGFRPDRPFVKCARVTGDTMAKYHPHGNQAIYDALVRMAQPFSKGPDFPTGARILGRAGSMEAYRTGRGSIRMRARAEIVEGKVTDEIVVSELPYQVSVNAVASKIAELVDGRTIEGIRDVKN